MAIDYRILDQGKVALAGSGIGQGVRDGMQRGYMDQLKNTANREFASGSPDMNAMLAGLSNVDPVRAMGMSNTNNNRGARASVFAMKQEATNTPEAKALMDKYSELAKQAVQVRQDDPKANIAPILNEMGLLESEFKNLTGVPMANRITAQTIRNQAQERAILETDEDDTYKAVENVVSEVSKSVDKDIVAFNKGAPNLKKAIELMQSAVRDGKVSASDVNSAIKIYVGALDNSAVMQGEVGQIAGDSWWGQFKGFINGAFSGVGMSKEQLNQLYDSMIVLAQANNNAIDSIMDGLKIETDARLDIANQSGRIGDVAKFKPSVDQVVNSKIGRYKVQVPSDNQRPVFSDVVFGESTPNKTSGSGGSSYVDPYEGGF